jgi:hypothetical protein
MKLLYRINFFLKRKKKLSCTKYSCNDKTYLLTEPIFFHLWTFGNEETDNNIDVLE